MPVETPYYQSSFSSKEVEQLLKTLNNWAKGGFATANTDADTQFDRDTITISGAQYAVVWQVAPTSSNQVYGLGLHKTTGRIYEIYSNKLSYSAQALDSNTANTAGSSNVTTQLYLIGAEEQSGNGVQTYSNSNVYMEDGVLYAEGTKVVVQGDDISDLNNDSGYITGIEILDLRNAE